MRGPSHKNKSYGTMKPGLCAEAHPSILDIAFAAGIFEGEGYVSGRGHKQRTCHVTVVQKDPWLPAWLKRHFGGSVNQYKMGPKGKLQNYNRWGISGTRARGFVFTIFSFLSPRRRQQIVLSLIERKGA